MRVCLYWAQTRTAVHHWTGAGLGLSSGGRSSWEWSSTGTMKEAERDAKGWNTQQITPEWGPRFCSQAVPKSEQCSESLGTSAHPCRVRGSRCSAPTAAIWSLFKAFAILVAQNLSNPYLYLCTACVYSFLSFANAGFQFKQLFCFPHSSLSQHN